MSKSKKEINLLNQGDVIKLEAGMKVYATIPEKFIAENRIFSDEKTKHEIIVGKIYKNSTSIKKPVQQIVKDVQEAFSHQGYILNVKDAEKFVSSKIKTPKPETFSVDKGEYLVIITNHDESEPEMGHTVYPNNHRVFCKKLNKGKYDKDGVEVNFYQTDSFNESIKKVKVLRQLKVSYV